MRITYKQSSAGEDDGITRFPNPRVTKVSECFTNDYPDRAKIFSALNADGFTISESDTDASLLFGIDVAIEARKWMSSLYPECFQKKTSRTIATAERRMKQNRVAYARVYITSRKTDKTVVVRVGYGNPKDTTGRSEEYSKLVAIMLVQVAEQLAEQWNRDAKNIRVSVEDYEECPGLVSEAEADFAERELRNKHRFCGHFKCGMCVASESGEPPEFNCRCYDSGKCKHK